VRTPKAKPFDLVGAIMDFEAGTQTQEQTLELFARLIKSGQAWKLQGMYGRQAKAFIEAGIIGSDGEITAYGKSLKDVAN
jgi:hypothetical protein